MTENKQLTYYRGRIKNPRWIHYHKATGKWCVHRTIHNIITYFGYYPTKEKAEEVVEFLNENDWNKDKLKEWLKDD